MIFVNFYHFLRKGGCDLNCPKCNFPLPGEADFCPQCGFVPKKKVSSENSAEATENIRPKKNIPAIVFGILFAISFVLLVYFIVQYSALSEENNENLGLIQRGKTHIYSLEQDISSKAEEISGLETELESTVNERDVLLEKQEYSDELLEVLASEKSWGYATENFHVDKGVMVLERFGGMQELKLYSTYYTTFTFELSDSEVCVAEWSDEEWINKDTTVYITPVASGYATLTFRNDLYESSFKVLIIVK